MWMNQLVFIICHHGLCMTTWVNFYFDGHAPKLAWLLILVAIDFRLSSSQILFYVLIIIKQFFF